MMRLIKHNIFKIRNREKYHIGAKRENNSQHDITVGKIYELNSVYLNDLTAARNYDTKM